MVCTGWIFYKNGSLSTQNRLKEDKKRSRRGKFRQLLRFFALTFFRKTIDKNF